MSNQRPPARPWLLRLASQSRNTDPPPPPQPAAAPAAPPPRVPLLLQGSLALGRTTPILPPQPTLPMATLPPIPPPALPPPQLPTPPPATMPLTSPPVLPPAALAPTPPPAPAPPPPQPLVTISAPKPATANGNRPATTPTTAEAPARPIIARPTPPASPVAATLTRWPTPPQTPKVIPNHTAATENARANINGTKVVLSNGAAEPLTNRRDSFNKRNGEAKAPSPALPKSEDSKTPATGNGSGSNKKSTERGTMAVTLAGRNIGAFMDLGAPYSHRIMKQQHQSFYERSQTESGVKKSDAIPETHRHTAVESGGGGKKPYFSLVNSNVQSVNNSLLLGAACIQGSPGVHINLGRNHRPKNGADASTQKSPPPLQ